MRRTSTCSPLPGRQPRRSGRLWRKAARRAERRPAAAECRPKRVADVPERHRLTSRTAQGYLLAVLMLCGCATAGANDMSAPPATPASATPSLTPHSNLSTYRSTRTYSETVLPVRLRIPAIDVDTRLEYLGLADDKSIDVDFEPSVAGWWEGGPRPGQVGPAVILGHVRWVRTGRFLPARLAAAWRRDSHRSGRRHHGTVRRDPAG